MITSRENRPAVVAQPLAEREWQVLGGDWYGTGAVRVIGFIEELGGTYELDVVEEPALRRFCGSFKDAMEYFEALESGEFAQYSVA